MSLIPAPICHSQAPLDPAVPEAGRWGATEEVASSCLLAPVPHLPGAPSAQGAGEGWIREEWTREQAQGVGKQPSRMRGPR